MYNIYWGSRCVPVVVGRNDRNVGGRLLLVNDIDSEADAQAKFPQAGSASNLPVDSDLDDASGGGPGTDTNTDSGRYLLLIHYLFITYSLLIRDLFILNEAVARVFKRLTDRLQGVVANTSFMTIAPEFSAHFF